MTKKTDFEGWTWFKFNNLGLVLGISHQQLQYALINDIFHNDPLWLERGITLTIFSKLIKLQISWVVIRLAFLYSIIASYLSVFSPNAGKYEQEKTPYLDTFHTVINLSLFSSSKENTSIKAKKNDFYCLTFPCFSFFFLFFQCFPFFFCYVKQFLDGLHHFYEDVSSALKEITLQYLKEKISSSNKNF